MTAVLSCDEVTKRSDRALDVKSEQWTLAEELVKVLQPFEVTTTFLSYEANASLSCLLPVIRGLLESLQKQAEDIPSVRQFKQKVATEIKLRWELDSLDTSSAPVLTPVVDDRFKILREFDKDEAEMVKAEIIERMESFSTSTDTANTKEDKPAEKKRKKESALEVMLDPEVETNRTGPAGRNWKNICLRSQY